MASFLHETTTEGERRMSASNDPRNGKQNAANREIAERPGKDDLHEQREPEQPVEGTVQTPSRPRAPAPAPSRPRPRR
jgi:hypothetical protein